MSIDHYTLTVTHNRGFKVYGFDTRVDHVFLGECISLVIQSKSWRGLDDLYRGIEAVSSGEGRSYATSDAGIEIVLTCDRVDFIMPFQDDDDYDALITRSFPLSVFCEALAIWLDFLDKVEDQDTS